MERNNLRGFDRSYWQGVARISGYLVGSLVCSIDRHYGSFAGKVWQVVFWMHIVLHEDGNAALGRLVVVVDLVSPR